MQTNFMTFSNVDVKFTFFNVVLCHIKLTALIYRRYLTSIEDEYENIEKYRNMST